MGKTDIYIINDSSSQELSIFAARLCEKIIKSGLPTQVVCSDTQQALLLSETLWSYRGTSFLANEVTATLTAAPFTISNAAQFENACKGARYEEVKSFLYLSPALVAEDLTFTRRFILTPNIEEELNIARALYKKLKDRDEEIHSHDLRRRA